MARASYWPLRILSTAGPTALLILRGEHDGQQRQDARVLDGGLATLLAEAHDHVLESDGGADADVLHVG